MLVFKCACGKACCASKAEAGASISCGSCGEKILVPHVSDPDCVLIFRRGDPENGRALSGAEFQHLLNEGGLYNYDLVWHQEAWLPLGKVYQLPPPPPVPMDAAIAEIALNLQDLPPVDGYPKVPRRKKRVVKFDSIQVAQDENGQSQAAPRDVKKSIFTGIKTIFVVAILVFGAVRLGRIVNFALKRVCHVWVVNTFDCNVRFKLSGYDWLDMPKATQATLPDVYVALPCRKKMRFVEAGEFAAAPSEAASATVQATALMPGSMRVPLRPGYDTVVNPGGRASFGVYDLEGLSALSLSSPELKGLSAEISANKAPASVLKVIVQIQDLVKDRFKEKRRDLFFSSRDYSFDTLNIARNADISNYLQEKKAKEVSDSPSETRLSLVYPAARNLVFRNGSLLFDPDKSETESFITLSTKEFIPKKGYALTSSAPRLQIRYDKHGLVLQLAALNGDIQGPQKALYKASWTYEARMNKAGKWSWRWLARYQKPSEPGKTGENWLLTIDQNGAENNEKSK